MVMIRVATEQTYSIFIKCSLNNKIEGVFVQSSVHQKKTKTSKKARYKRDSLKVPM